MTFIFLLILGLFLVLAEFYLPGAILGILGAVLIITSLVLFISQGHLFWEIILYILLIIASLYAVIRFAIWRIPRAKGKFSIYSSTSQNGYQASSFDQSCIGKTGTVLTDLKPGGYILIDGIQHQALSEVGYITKGTKVVVLSGEGESLIVKEEKKI